MTTPAFDPARYKARQLESWDDAAAGWRNWWELIERPAQEVSDRLLELANVRPGHRVLDVATGIGEPAATAARKVGPDGYVVATDISPGMLEIARERASSLGLNNLEFRETDTESLDVPEGSFDAAPLPVGSNVSARPRRRAGATASRARSRWQIRDQRLDQQDGHV